jgi:hypothetical protein
MHPDEDSRYYEREIPTGGMQPPWPKRASENEGKGHPGQGFKALPDNRRSPDPYWSGGVSGAVGTGPC